MYYPSDYFIPYDLTYSVTLVMKWQCDRTLHPGRHRLLGSGGLRRRSAAHRGAGDGGSMPSRGTHHDDGRHVVSSHSITMTAAHHLSSLISSRLADAQLPRHAALRFESASHQPCVSRTVRARPGGCAPSAPSIVNRDRMALVSSAQNGGFRPGKMARNVVVMSRR